MTARVVPRATILPLILPLEGCLVGLDYHRPTPAFPPAARKMMQMIGTHIKENRDQKASAVLNNLIRANDERVKDHLEKIVRSSPWEELTALLDAEAIRL